MATSDVSVRVFQDGDQWCALIGDDLQSGIAGFGPSANDALSQLIKYLYAKATDNSPELRPMPPVEVRNRDGRVQQLYFAKDTEPYCLHHGLYEFKDGLFSWVEPTESESAGTELDEVDVLFAQFAELSRKVADLERYNRLTLATGNEVKALKGQVRELQQRSDATNDLLEQIAKQFDCTLDVLTDLKRQVEVLTHRLGGLDIRTDQLRGQVKQIEGSKRWVELDSLHESVETNRAEVKKQLGDLGARFSVFEENLATCMTRFNRTRDDETIRVSVIQDLRDRLEALEKRSATPSIYDFAEIIQSARAGNIPVTEPVTLEVINRTWTDAAE